MSEDIPDGTQMRPGEVFLKRWRLLNSGTSTWADGCNYGFFAVSGHPLGSAGKVPLGDLERVSPEESIDLYVDMVAPSSPGVYRSTWSLKNDWYSFGTDVWAEIEVVACETHADCPNPDLSRCNAGSCVQCMTGGDCSAPTSTCQDHTCIDPDGCGEGAEPTFFSWPVPDVSDVCQAFGNPITYQTCEFHTGTDICGELGMDIVAMADGRVVYVGPLWLSGETTGRGPVSVVVQHSPSFYSTYGHNSAALVAVGDCVTAGQKIAEMGATGYSSEGPHLHFEVVRGTPFTGDWETPFNNPCDHYEDLEDYVSP